MTQSGAPAPARTAISLPCSASELALALGAQLIGDPDTRIERPGTVHDTEPNTVTFIRSGSFAKHWDDSGCAAAIIPEDIELAPGEGRALLVVPCADEAFVRILRAVDPGRDRPAPGIHPTATIDPSASIHETAAIGPGSVVGANSVVGPRCVLTARCVVGASVTIGESTVLEPGVVVDDRTVIGARCILGANSVLGADGFGYIPPTDDHAAIKVPQIGRVVLGDEVELGACVTIDRAKLGDTRIGHRVKLDNQVHIGHNCSLGDDTILCGRATLGGSCTVGSRVLIGGSVTLNDQSTVGDNAKIAGGAIVLETVGENESVAGIPAIPARKALSNYAALRDIAATLKALDKRLKAIEKS